MNNSKICPHLNCLVYHPDGVCRCDMARYCGKCKAETAGIPDDQKWQVEKNQHSVTKALIHSEIIDNPQSALEFVETALNALYEYKAQIDKRNSNIWMIVKSIKPEYLTELRKLIIPEVFTDLGLD